MKTYSDSTKLNYLKYRESLLLSRGETINFNLLRKIRREIRKLEKIWQKLNFDV